MCYANPQPIFQSAMRLITALTNTFPAQVTTSFAHQYQTGEIVRIIIPRGYGMQQINKQQGTIAVTSPTTFTIDIDATAFDPFFIPPVNPGRFYTCAQTTPIGERNDMLSAATRNVLPF